LRNAGNDSGVCFYRKRDRAVWSAKRAEISQRAVSPKRGVAALIAGEIRIPRKPVAIVDAVGPTVRSAQRGEVSDAVLRL